MNSIQWGVVLALFLAALAVPGAILWRLIEAKSFRVEELRSEFACVLTELNAIRAEIANIRERLAALKERDRFIKR